MGFQLFKAMTFIFRWKTLALVLPWLLLMKYSRYRMTYFYASSPFSSGFFFLYYSLTHRNFQKTFLSSILHTGNRTLSHPHKYTHILSVTSIYYLLAINLQRSQSAPPHPRVQMALFGTESGIGTSRALLPVWHNPCSFSQVHFSPQVGTLKKMPLLQ